MYKFIFFFLILFSTFQVFSNIDSIRVKARKLSYSDFMAKYSKDNTSAALIELFFDKKENVAIGEMSLLPITAIVFIFSPKMGLGTSLISFPIFIHGLSVLIKYRKHRLLNVLVRYNKNGFLAKRLRRKTNKLLKLYEGTDGMNYP